jgi:hypothetical protein
MIDLESEYLIVLSSNNFLIFNKNWLVGSYFLTMKMVHFNHEHWLIVKGMRGKTHRK